MRGRGSPGRLRAAYRSRLVPLHVCERCGSGLAHPTDLYRLGADRWLVALRCPECETVSVGVQRSKTVMSLLDEVEAGTATLHRDLVRLRIANREDEAERLGRGAGAC